MKSKEIDGWSSIEICPPEARELYIVVQETEDGEKVRAAAFWEQDGDGKWGWNKPHITHWTKWPEMPSK